MQEVGLTLNARIPHRRGGQVLSPYLHIPSVSDITSVEKKIYM